MDATTFLSLVRRRWLPIAACLLAGIAGAVSLTRSTPDTYRASSRLYLSIPAARGVQDALVGVQLSANLVKSYAAIATSRNVSTAVAERLGPRVSVGSVHGHIGATPIPDTLLISISATDQSAARAQLLANTAAVVFIEVVADLEQGRADSVTPRIIDRATLPSVPISPRPRSNLALGGVLGLATGLVLAVTLEGLDRSLRTPHEAAEHFAAPLLGLVPRRRNAASHPLLTEDDVGSPGAEAYRAIRTAVRFVHLDRPLRTILITSPSPGDGKTLTAANLALAVAQGGERVVLVDADLRKSSIPQIFEIPAAPGLTSVAIGEATGEDVLRPVGDRLAILPPGDLPPNPSEILGSQVVANMLTSLASTADVVIIDCPPVMAVTDAVVLATQVDAVILVGRHGRTQRAQAAEARRRLDVVNANVIGCVFNGTPPSASYVDEYRYTSYQGPPVEAVSARPLRRWRRSA